jgi:hypothetical protein
VTVHGIRDDYKTAWTDAQGAWWVKDQLFQRMSTREVDYSYDIDAASTLYEPGGLMQHARTLITEYAAVRHQLEEVSSLVPVLSSSSVVFSWISRPTLLTIACRPRPTDPSYGFATISEGRL